MQEKGNVSTLGQYLELLGGTSMICGLQKYSVKNYRRKRSIPKVQVFDTSLMSAMSRKTFEMAQSDRSYWGRLAESAVGAHVAKAAAADECEAFYWRDGDFEVDYVADFGGRLLAIEVKSGTRVRYLEGLARFSKIHPHAHTLLVSEQDPRGSSMSRQYDPGSKFQESFEGVAMEDFLSKPVSHWLER